MSGSAPSESESSTTACFREDLPNFFFFGCSSSSFLGAFERTHASSEVRSFSEFTGTPNAPNSSSSTIGTFSLAFGATFVPSSFSFSFSSSSSSRVGGVHLTSSASLSDSSSLLPSSIASCLSSSFSSLSSSSSSSLSSSASPSSSSSSSQVGLASSVLYLLVSLVNDHFTFSSFVAFFSELLARSNKGGALGCIKLSKATRASTEVALHVFANEANVNALFLGRCDVGASVEANSASVFAALKSSNIFTHALSRYKFDGTIQFDS
mmetsp:Transcript_7742/g.23073  ORF Transcript_7742/g.23073 Transcript_7742/m.23073 type:complete len:266 (-) Transcript_7742:1533-2330(-)